MEKTWSWMRGLAQNNFLLRRTRRATEKLSSDLGVFISFISKHMGLLSQSIIFLIERSKYGS